jgi:hypothetical protein
MVLCDYYPSGGHGVVLLISHIVSAHPMRECCMSFAVVLVSLV